MIVPVRCNNSDYQYLMNANKYSAEVWNYCVKIDQECKESSGKQMKFSELQSAVKKFRKLSSKNNQLTFMKYYYSRDAMWKSIKTKHENSDKVKLPYKEKKFFNTRWDYSTIRYDRNKNIIMLNKAMIGEGGYGKRQNPVSCRVKNIPPRIVEVELLYRKGLKLAIKYKEPDIENVILSNNAASIDLGEIHSITSIDTQGNSIIITGRKIRTIKRLRNKEWGKLKSKQSRCVKGSIQYNKYSKAMYNLKYKTDHQIMDAVHKITKLYLDYCLTNKISLVYYGDVDSATRNSKGKVGNNGQKLSQWNHGEIMNQLTNKLSRYNIQMIKVPEYYTSQACPSCGLLNKPKGRNYICECGYTQHRDILGSINILNMNHGTELQQYKNKMYLRIE